MTFPESVEVGAKSRARGICECARNNCPHYGRCRVRGLEYHHTKRPSAGGSAELSNCEFLCTPCHERAHGESDFGRI